MAAQPTSRRSWWLAAVLAAAALHMLVFDRGLGGDGWAGFAVLASLADDSDLWLENNDRGQVNGLIANAAGHLVSQYPPGGPLLDAAPFFAGRALDALLPHRLLAAGVDLPPLGRVPRGVFFSSAAIVLARNVETLLGLLWTAFALRRLGCGRRATAFGVALAFFGGPLIFYSLVGMTHAPAFALASLLLLLLVRHRQAPGARSALGAGLTLGAAVLVRYDAAALLAPALLALRGVPAAHDLPRIARRWAGVFALGLALPLLALPPWWRACFGSWLPPAYGGRVQLSFASPWNVLFSPVHGMAWFHPALLIAVLGLAFGGCRCRLRLHASQVEEDWRAWRWIALAWFLVVALLHGWWSEWANLGGYGQRFLCDALPVLALGFAWLAARLMVAGRVTKSLGVGSCLAAAAIGYGLFFAAVGGLAAAPPPFPWPLRLTDYARLAQQPPGAAPSGEIGELGHAFCRASYTARLLVPGCRR
jgi:hypothetical protein